MSSAEQYRQSAAECLRLAQEATDPNDKARLLQMAQAWRELADKAPDDIKKDYSKKD